MIDWAWKGQKKYDERFFALRSLRPPRGCLGMPMVFLACCYRSGLLALLCMPFGISGLMTHLGLRTRMSGLIDLVFIFPP